MNAPDPQRLDDATIERARSAVSLVALVARRVKLRRAGRDWSGLCPFHQEKNPSFTVGDAKGFYHCFGCGAHGDAIRWIMETEGLAFREAVLSLLGGALPDARRPMQVEQRAVERVERHDFVSSATAGRWIWQTSFPARGELTERYLESRGLDPALEPLPGFPAIDQLRFHPRCPVSVWRVLDDPNDARLTAPALVAPVGDAEGAVWGVRVTFLAPDGRGPARLPLAQGRERPSRKMFGRIARHAWFATPAETMCSDAPLVVGEGLETTWAFVQQLRTPVRAVATLSLENLQGGAVRLRDGSLPLWNMKADPERPPFLVDGPGAVTLLIDADMKPLRDQKVQIGRGQKPRKADLNGLERAEICAALAAQAWRRAGASSVRCVRPRAGQDFNDQVRGIAA